MHQISLTKSDRSGASRPATTADRARARELLFSREGQAAADRPPPRLSLAELLKFHLDSAVFTRSTFGATVSPGLDEHVNLGGLLWARQQLPISADTRRKLAGAITRADVLGALFSDQTFLAATASDEPRGWTPAAFLPAVSPSDSTRRFLDRIIDARSPLLDPTCLASWGLKGSPSADDLYRFGELTGFRANDLFDAAFYARTAATGLTNYFDNLRAYVEGGEAGGGAPNPFVNPGVIIASNPDIHAVIQSGWLNCCLEQLLGRDHAESRSAAVHFDVAYYLTQTSEADRSRYSSPFAHYVNEGWRAGLEPNPCFDQLWYLRAYPDVREAVAAGVWPNAFAHFVMEGEAAGRWPNAFFDPAAYGRANFDIAQSKSTTPFRHMWQQGRFEARDLGSPDFTPIARQFVRRLPDSRDRIENGRVIRASGAPADVLAAATAPADGRDVVSVLKSGRFPAKWPVLIGDLLKRLGRARIAVEVGKTQQIHAGDVARLYVSGLASFGLLPLQGIHVVSDVVDLDCEVFRYDRLEEVEANAVFGGRAADLKTGFMAWFEFSARGLPAGVQYLDLAFVFGADGDPQTMVTHESIQVQVYERPMRSDSSAPVQVAMATYNPPAGPFATQVETILANPGVHLLISDDASPPAGARVLTAYADRPRIDVDVNSQNANFVSNFERSLYMRSDAAEVLLFADQDDVWQADKVRTLQAMLAPGVACAFSDMRIVKGDGEVISETFWEGRQVHHADPLTLGVANTVTGAAAAFPVWLAEIMTPFPRYMGVYHDQWLAVVAAAAGRIEYTSRPLYDYIQHGANVLGFSGSRSGTEAHWQPIARSLRAALRRGAASDRDLAYVDMATASAIPLLQRFVLLNEALIRVPVWSDPEVRSLALGLSDAIKGRPFDAKRLLRGWRKLARRAGGADGLLNIDDMFVAVLSAWALIDRGVVTSPMFKATRDEAYRARARQIVRDGDPDMGLFERKTQAIAVRPSSVASRSLRINMFLPELQLGTFFGGYHSKISLITRLQARGIETRLILVDQAVVDHGGVARIVGAFPELENGLMRSQIEPHGARGGVLEIGPRDVLLATTWWSAHIVNAVRRDLDRERFLYFVQEYEPFTFELGTNYRGAEMTYDFPHDALFSTDILRDYFAQAGVGVFGPHALPDASALDFRNPITGLKGLVRRPVLSRRPRLLFYARPQAHASRNMYEFGVAALRQVVQALGTELDGWDLVGVGASANAQVNLGGGRELRLISKLDASGYRQMLATSDVGLALMYTPHPSLVPLEMAAAGLVTVTNACMTKTPAAFAGISDLIDVADPDIPEIAASLIRAVRRVNAGSVPHEPIDWPVDPQGAFPDAWLDRFLEIAARSLPR